MYGLYLISIIKKQTAYSGGDIMSSRKAVVFAGVICLIVFGAVSAYDVPNPNFNNDGTVDFLDFRILANNWQQTGAGLVGDFDDNNSVDVDDLMVFSWYWLAEYSEYQQCEGMGTDLDADGIIAFEDMAIFAQSWLMTGVGLAGDLDKNDIVDSNDLKTFCDCWLKGTRPESIWEQFKAASLADDLDKALTFIADSVLDQYTDALTQLRPYFPDMVAGMGELILISKDSQTAKYEMLHDEGGGVISCFPVYFRRDELGNWKIYCF
jgi:hypothetical protein